jgi:hypothetical protein
VYTVKTANTSAIFRFKKKLKLSAKFQALDKVKKKTAFNNIKEQILNSRYIYLLL